MSYYIISYVILPYIIHGIIPYDMSFWVSFRKLYGFEGLGLQGL